MVFDSFTGGGANRKGKDIGDIVDDVASLSPYVAAGLRGAGMVSEAACLEVGIDGVQRIVGSKSYREKSKNTAKKKLASSSMLGSSALTAQEGHKTLPIKFNLGKDLNIGQVQSESIRNLLSNASASGSVVTEFSGYLECPQGSRVYTAMNFRHNLSDNANIADNGAYNSSNNILMPTAGSTVPFPGSVTPHDDNPYHKHTDMSMWFAPMNRSDLEDISWTLNRLKFNRASKTAITGYGSGTSVDPINTPSVLQGDEDVAFWEQNSHRRQSAIYKNNLTHTGSSGYNTAPYKYNMVFSKGSVKYNFMNKGHGALECNIAVFKVKKNNQTSTNHADYNGTEFFDHVKSALRNGLQAADNRHYGTDQLNGASPYLNFFHDASKQFLPTNSLVRQSELSYKEVTRQSFALQAGDKRLVTFKFGGEVYDPVNDAPEDSTGAYKSYILDSHTYIVVISINGTKLTRQYTADGTDYRMGDMYGPADLQWNAEYTENIQAAQYKKPPSTKIKVLGAETSFPGSTTLADNLTKGAEDPSLILGQEALMRVVGAASAQIMKR